MSDWTDEDEQPIANALENVARQIRNLGNADAATPMGALEALGKVFDERLPLVATETRGIELALDGIADAISEQAAALDKLATAMARIAFQIEHTSWFGS